MSSPLQSNTSILQNILDTINNLPESSSGVTLPSLTSEGSAADLISGKQLVNSNGEVVTGTMPNNGTITSTIDGINTKSVSVPSGYTSGGTVSLTDDIDNEIDAQADLIAQVMEVLGAKTGFNTIYIGSAVPTDDIGVTGDIYIVRGES